VKKEVDQEITETTKAAMATIAEAIDMFSVVSMCIPFLSYVEDQQNSAGRKGLSLCVTMSLNRFWVSLSF